MIHEILPVGLLECNCSILGDENTREAIVIDPGDDIEQIVELLRRHHLRVKSIIITHAHIDHIGGAKKLKDLTGAPVYMNERDVELYGTLEQQAGWIGVPAPQRTPIDGLLKDADVVDCGSIRARVLHTPGHTEGSICLLVRDGATQKLIAGDTLFRNSIGRTDLPGGNFRSIMESLREKVLTLDDATLVIPGHGPETTIGREREYNPFLQGR